MIQKFAKLRPVIIWLLLAYVPCASAANPSNFDGRWRQLPYTSAWDCLQPSQLQARFFGPSLPVEIPGRHVPELVSFDALKAPNLAAVAVPLPEANTFAHVNFQKGRFGRLNDDATDVVRFFNPECVLVKFRGAGNVSALHVEPMREWDAVRILRKRADVDFAELDTFESPQFMPDDPLITNQWHHRIIGSFRAWDHGLGQAFVRIAIVDHPFQVDHPDLAANTVSGWDAVANAPIKPGKADFHATMCAGMAAAVINNGKGVAGAGNCKILPLNINGAISEMYNATIWAADHGVRVVNISWSGANTDTLEDAGRYLKEKAGGILVMPGQDGIARLNWTNQPDIYCIAMTDEADNPQSSFGPHVDFAAPGYRVYSTAPRGSYARGSGTSYAAPLFAGVVAALLSLDPTRGPDDVIGILKRTAIQPGARPWNEFFGWGRIKFDAAAEAALRITPTAARWKNGQATITGFFTPGLRYSLQRTTSLDRPEWSGVTNAVAFTNGIELWMTDPTPPTTNAWYHIKAAMR